MKDPKPKGSEAVREFNLKNKNKFVDIKKIILYLHK